MDWPRPRARRAALRCKRGARILRGFSLLELVMVVCVLGILAATAIPKIASSLQRNRAEAAARRIASDMNLAQARARQASASQRVVFDVAGGSYTLVGMMSPDHPTAAYVVSLKDSPYEVLIVSANLGGDAQIIFNGYGVPDSDGTVLIQAGSFWRSVSVAAETGRVTVAESFPPVGDVSGDAIPAK